MASRLVRLRNVRRALFLEPSDQTQYIIAGRVANIRNYKSFNFVDLIDGSTRDHLQLVIKKSLLKRPELGSYLTCRGNLIKSPGSKQTVEFKVNQIDQIGKCDPDNYPLVSEAKNRTLSDGWFRQNLHLRPRASHFGALLRVRSELELAFHMIFKQMDFFRVHTPILTANDSEASSDLFVAQRCKQKISRLNTNSQSGQSSDSFNGGRVADDDEDDEDDDKIDSDTKQAYESAREGAESGQLEQPGNMSQRSLESEYFNRQVFMNTSAQLHLECLASSLSRVYCLSPAFRAESSLSQRHLCEFLMLEAEEANLDQLEPLMDRLESVVKFVAQYLAEVSEFSADFACLLDKYSNHQVYECLAHSKYVRMTYDEALKILQNLSSKPASLGDKSVSSGTGPAQGMSWNPACHYGCDINRWHERQLLKYCNDIPIFITHYPRHLKPFYMKCDPSARTALNFDLIAPHGGEICGGSLREDNIDLLRQNIDAATSAPGRLPGARNSSDQEHIDHGLDDKINHIRPNDNRFQWYLDLRQFGTFPHGGFGLGFERLVQSLVGVRNIRDTLAFPRWPGHCPM